MEQLLLQDVLCAASTADGERGASSLPPLTQQELCKAGDAPKICSVRISTEAQQAHAQCFIQHLPAWSEWQ